MNKNKKPSLESLVYQREVSQKKPKPAKKFVYMFEEGNRDMVELLGGKGANLAEMVSLGLPVPPGFTITTEAFQQYKRNNYLSSSLKKQIDEGLKRLEQKTGKNFGSSKNPLLVSVRSGAAVSMPGMMETVLNVGMNEDAIEGLLSLADNPRFVCDTYRRFVKMFTETVIGLDTRYSGGMKSIEQYIDHFFPLESKGVFTNSSVWRSNIQYLYGQIERYATYDSYRTHKWTSIPQDPKKQLYNAIEAVFRSWNQPKAREYRNIHNISNDLGTAVNIQAMVFGNKGMDSFTGVCFSRDTDSGQKILDGEILYGAQGEDIVAGSITPINISELKKKSPSAYEEIARWSDILERHYKDIQDIEFTKEGKKLYFLQTRKAKRSRFANITATLDMLDEVLIDEKKAIERISEEDINFILNQTIINPEQNYTVIGIGETSSGLVEGKVAFTSNKAIEYQKNGDKVILVKKSTDTNDISGMRACEGILTAAGGQTSHAAVVARGMNKTCIAGCKTLEYREQGNSCYFNLGNNQQEKIKEGEYLTLNGNTGEVIKGRVKTIKPANNPLLTRLEQLVLPYLKENKVAEVNSASEINEGSAANAELGIFGVSPWFLAGDNLDKVRDYLMSPKSEKKPLEHVMRNLTERYESIFAAVDSRVYCNLLDEGLELFIPDKNATRSYYQILHTAGNLLAEYVKEKQNKLLSRAETIEELPIEDRKRLEKGIFETQIYAIITAANNAKSSPVINISSGLIKRFGNDPIKSFIKRMINKAKKDIGYTSEIEVTTEIEKNQLVFRPSTYIQDAFAYVKKGGNFK